MPKHFTRKIGIIVAALFLVYLLLLIPGREPVAPTDDTTAQPFAWNQDEYWSSLEARFNDARRLGCDSLRIRIGLGLDSTGILISSLSRDSLQPDDTLFHQIETQLFGLSCLISACPDSLQSMINLHISLRYRLMNQAQHWDMNSRAARDRVYRLIYGGRTALEEVMLQAGPELSPELVPGIADTLPAGSFSFMGVTIQSGDIFISRGGAPTSALIARGNDYPGNFSHAALACLDRQDSLINGFPEPREIYLVESHIERGVVVSDIDDYLKDTKLRILILRFRSDHPALKSNDTLPVVAAKYAMANALAKHIPYDFAMDISDPSKLFCSEVVSFAYKQAGINLWASRSHISSPGVRNWLADFGVKNFTTQEPSDLEYDPQLQVVAEWRDFETLYKDHLDNAVVDVMLEDAERGMKLKYNIFMLPVARILKLYSSILNLFDKAGPIPEGMNSTAALKNEWFSGRHREIEERLEVLAHRFSDENGYLPPYWELVKLARRAKDSI